MRPEEITAKSFDIIRSRLKSFSAPPNVLDVVIRIAHTTGDVDFAKQFIIPQSSVEAGVEALKSGHNVVTDVEMVRAGIRRRAVEQAGGRVLCFLNNPEVAGKADELGKTRSAVAIEEAAEYIEGGIVAIGNAPTALQTVCDLVDEGKCAPALIVGVPVGFVGAAESKERLASMAVHYITVLGERGGSPIAAAIVNALIALALQNTDRAMSYSESALLYTSVLGTVNGLRRGITTGTCAQAAAKAAVTMLYSGKEVDRVIVKLPKSKAPFSEKTIMIPVEEHQIKGDCAVAGVRKQPPAKPKALRAL